MVMKRLFNYLFLMLTIITFSASCSKDDEPEINTEDTDDVQYEENRKILVAYFSATGTTQRLAQQIATATNADIFRIEAANPYAANPYDDSDRIQNESYNNLRPEVATLPRKY